MDRPQLIFNLKIIPRIMSKITFCYSLNSNCRICGFLKNNSSNFHLEIKKDKISVFSGNFNEFLRKFFFRLQTLIEISGKRKISILQFP